MGLPFTIEDPEHNKTVNYTILTEAIIIQNQWPEEEQFIGLSQLLCIPHIIVTSPPCRSWGEKHRF